MHALSPVQSASPVVAIAERPIASPAQLYTGSPVVVIALNVQDPGNVGAIVRVAEAGGAGGVVCAGACADPFGWKALRGSMGSALRLPILMDRDSRDAIDQARGSGCRVVAMVPRGGRPLFDADLRGAIAVLIGGEGSGLPATHVEEADERITIPMESPVESLNTAVTAAVILYEAYRQRKLDHGGHKG
jgi:TrmH family RNA methyltransferase